MRTAVALVLLCLSARSATAQVPEFRFHGGPSDRCQEFMIFETSLYQTPFNHRLPPVPYSSKENHYVNWEFGWMKNTGPHTAWGASLYLATDLFSGRVAVLPRYRRWLSEHAAADLAAGPIVLDTGTLTHGGLGGGIGRASFDLSNLISLTAQVDVLRRDSAWKGFGYVGVRAGSFLAIPATLANLLLASSWGTQYFSPERHPVSPS